MPRRRASAPTIACRELAAAQHGLLTREQAIGAGLAKWAIGDEIARGAWVPVRPGVYRSTSASVTWHQRALAACIGKTGAIALSHRSAAFVHGLLPEPPAAVEVMTRYGAPRAGIRLIATVHRVRRPPTPGEMETVEGLPVTSLARTLVDLAGCLPSHELAELVDRAVRSRRSDAARRRLLRALQEALPGRFGAVALRDALRPWTVTGPGKAQPQSVLEAQVLRVLARADLPVPTPQHLVVLPGGDRFYLDFAWPAARVALEVDGYAFHSDRRSFSSDRQRGNRLLAAGWQVLHTTSDEITHQPETLVEMLRAALGTRKV